MNKEFSSLDESTKKNQMESVTPYKVAVMVFIKIYCSNSDRRTKEISEKRDFCVTSLKLIQSPDLDFKSLLKLMNPPESTLTNLSLEMERVLESICQEGVKDLLDLFDSLGDLMKPPDNVAMLSRHSVLGLYIRRTIILFDKLTFHKVVTLFEDLKLYIREGCENENMSMDTSRNDNPFLRRAMFKNTSDHSWGGRQAELFVAQQAHALLNDEHKALPPPELETLIKDLLSSCPYYAEAHYLRYLNYLRVNEYFGAIDSLYHCFDRLTLLESRPTSEDKLRTFRYASLNLASLYAQFGHKELAQNALKEAIMLAQEAGDNFCLQLAHSWVYYLTDKNKGLLIERSVSKATALGMHHTASLALIASAHNSAMEGKSPQVVFETLTKSDVLNNQYRMIDLISMIHAEKTALWAYYGKTEMSSVCAQLLLLFNSGSEKKQLMFNGPSTCQAVVTIANILHEMAEYNLANVVLEHAKERFPNQPSSYVWSLSEQLHAFERSLRNEKWSLAEEIAEQIAILNPVESKFRVVEVLFARHDFPGALKLAYELDALPDITAQQRVRAKLLICQIKCGSIDAGTAQSAADSVLLLSSALEIAKSNHLSYYESLVIMYMANCQLLLRMPYQALRNCNQAIITILAHGGLYDQARAHVTYAKCLSANAAKQTEDDKRYMVLEGVKHLKKAKKLLEKLEANDRLKSTIYFMAVFYNEVGMLEERNKCAYQFRELDQLFPTDVNNVFLF